MAESVIAEREALWEARGADDMKVELEGTAVGSAVDARKQTAANGDA
jgi:hypothetical protein